MPEWTIGVPAGATGSAPDWLFLSRDPAIAARRIRHHSESDAVKWGPFCDQLHKLAGFLGALYQLPPPDIESTRLGAVLPLLGIARQLRGLGREDMIGLLRMVPMPVAELLDDWFESGPVKAAVGAVGVSGIRQGPRSGGTGFVLLHHLVGTPRGAIGRWGEGYWRSGPLALVEALVAQGRLMGVELKTGATVARIVVKDDQVTAVVLEGGEEVATPLVLSSADHARTMGSLIDPIWLDPDLMLAVRNIKFRGSLARVSYALDGLPAFARPDGGQARTNSDSERPIGTLQLSGKLDQLERGADSAKYGRVSDGPFITIRIPSLQWPDFAPAGKHVVVAEVQWTPWRLREGEWDGQRREALGEVVTTAIEQVTPGFRALVRSREVLTPTDLEYRYGLTEGAPSQGELMLDQILFMRPIARLAQYATPVQGLYLCGAGSHPGPGISGGPGWLAARAALRQPN